MGEIYCRNCGSKFVPSKKNKILCTNCKPLKEVRKVIKRNGVRLSKKEWSTIVRRAYKLNKVIQDVVGRGV